MWPLWLIPGRTSFRQPPSQILPGWGRTISRGLCLQLLLILSPPEKRARLQSSRTLLPGQRTLRRRWRHRSHTLNHPSIPENLEKLTPANPFIARDELQFRIVLGDEVGCRLARFHHQWNCLSSQCKTFVKRGYHWEWVEAPPRLKPSRLSVQSQEIQEQVQCLLDVQRSTRWNHNRASSRKSVKFRNNH